MKMFQFEPATMLPRIIKTEAQYRTYLQELERLAAADPDPSSPEGEQLDLLALIVQAYEKERAKIPQPSPINAILFRMEESGLQQKDLIPYIGSKSKVSEVLAGRRPLSLNMIRKLSQGLGVSADVLLQETEKTEAADTDEDLSLYPMREMLKRGWLGHLDKADPDSLTNAVRRFFDAATGNGMGPAYCRRTTHFGGEVSTDFYAINAWIARVLVRSRENRANLPRFAPPSDPLTMLTSVAKLSWSETGPLLATEYLRNHGIVLVIERHLPRTKLDGAAMLDQGEVPVIGLTLRFDRLDNFWFTLLHELAHVCLHISSSQEAYMDNTHIDPAGEKAEQEANGLAQDALIPRSRWRRSRAYLAQTTEAILELAKELGIHPAIVAGRLSMETGNYSRFSKLVAAAHVRKHFPEF